MIQFLKASSSSFLDIVVKFSVIAGKYLEHVQAKGFFFDKLRRYLSSKSKVDYLFLRRKYFLVGWLIGW